MDAYFYIPVDEKDHSLSCGVKLSEKGSKKVNIDGYATMCISSLLNPKDIPGKYNSDRFACLRIDINPEHCYIADLSLFEENGPNNLYNKSIISPTNYVFGMYRKPECLIPRTILPDRLTLCSKVIDFPVLYESSEELYVNNLLEKLKDSDKNSSETILKLYFDKLSEQGSFKKVTIKNLNIYSNPNGEVITVKNVNK